MALLELALDAVEIGGIEMVAGVGLLDDVVVDRALFQGASVVGLLLVLGHGGAGQGGEGRGGGGRRKGRKGGAGAGRRGTPWRGCVEERGSGGGAGGRGAGVYMSSRVCRPGAGRSVAGPGRRDELSPGRRGGVGAPAIGAQWRRRSDKEGSATAGQACDVRLATITAD